MMLYLSSVPLMTYHYSTYILIFQVSATKYIYLDVKQLFIVQPVGIFA